MCCLWLTCRWERAKARSNQLHQSTYWYSYCENNLVSLSFSLNSHSYQSHNIISIGFGRYHINLESNNVNPNYWFYQWRCFTSNHVQIPRLGPSYIYWSKIRVLGYLVLVRAIIWLYNKGKDDSGYHHQIVPWKTMIFSWCHRCNNTLTGHYMEHT